jgi:hypothetical protein
MFRRSLLGLILATVACQSSPQGAPPPWTTVEVGATAAASPVVLDSGALFLLRALRRVPLSAGWVDAEYAGLDGDPFGAADVVGQADVGIDVGFTEVLPARGRKPAPVTDRRVKWFGAFRGDHVYYMIVTGAGRPLIARLIQPQGAQAGSGTIEISVFRLSPVPSLGKPLETVMVPAREKVAVHSTLVGEAGKIYLLQAAGEVQVGGPGHMGDGEFHDYKADGRGYNEGEEGVDFGVGVDEPVIGLGHDPRARKWGPYRRDHTYYMLYAGTGQPIVLNYHDTGGKSGVYKDNAGSLPVRIFSAP